MKTDLNLLRVLLAVYETGNVTTAAARLGMSQPAASAALARLRHSLGDPLFMRRELRMEATPRAESMIAPIREVIEVIDRDILPNPRFDPGTCTDELVLCLSEIGEVVFLPSIFNALRQHAPRVRIRTISLSPPALEAALHDGKVHAVLGYYPDLNGNDIFQQRLFSHDLVCMIGRQHRVRGKRMTMKQFTEAEHVLVRDGGRSQEMFERDLANRAIERKIVLQTSHYMSIPALIAGSELVVVLPRTVASLFAHSDSVRIVETPGEIQKYDLKQYWHRRFHSEPRSVWLRGTLSRLFADAPSQGKNRPPRGGSASKK